MIRINVKGHIYYVYSHSYRGRVFYVGMGTGSRAFSVRKTDRGNRWVEYVKTIPNFQAHIIKEFGTVEEAKKYETKLIKKLRPFANIAYNGKTISTDFLNEKDDRVKSPITTLSEAGRIGAVATNKLLTPEKRRRAAKKGWRLRKQRLKVSQGK